MTIRGHGWRRDLSGTVSSKPFAVSGFSLPVAVVYFGDSAVSAQKSSIASSNGVAQAFVQRLVTQTVFDDLD
ncbi:hypothetical protein KIN20_027817 [Parelaphostrongylus tenuis]|uniref:Uncharacterized protein n=1 Tax=Parelaphostrongylus tenuis TaxID=148309 RepID=A0AAD5QZV0_PARTN|nr:hypothetical protein KIN20_027817 [Parelaphostrongylus tenuis]